MPGATCAYNLGTQAAERRALSGRGGISRPSLSERFADILYRGEGMILCVSFCPTSDYDQMSSYSVDCNPGEPFCENFCLREPYGIHNSSGADTYGTNARDRANQGCPATVVTTYSAGQLKRLASRRVFPTSFSVADPCISAVHPRRHRARKPARPAGPLAPFEYVHTPAFG